MAYASWLSSYLDRNPDEAARMRSSVGPQAEPVVGAERDPVASPASAQAPTDEMEQTS